MSHEEQAQRPKYTGSFNTNRSMTLQLVYSFVFGAICPVAPVLLYLWILNRQYWQRTALVYVFQRPHPQAAPGGGFWAEALPIVVCLGLAVQLPLILFCSRALTYWAPQVSLSRTPPYPFSSLTGPRIFNPTLPLPLSLSIPAQSRAIPSLSLALSLLPSFPHFSLPTSLPPSHIPSFPSLAPLMRARALVPFPHLHCGTVAHNGALHTSLEPLPSLLLT